MPIDEKAAQRLDKAILNLPRKCEVSGKRLDYPRLIVYHYLGRIGPGQFRKACRKIGIRVSEYDDRVQTAITILAQAIDCNHKPAYKP